MAYGYGDKRQVQLFPPSIEEYVGPDDPVRVYDVFPDRTGVESLDLAELGIVWDEHIS